MRNFVNVRRSWAKRVGRVSLTVCLFSAGVASLSAADRTPFDGVGGWLSSSQPGLSYFGGSNSQQLALSVFTVQQAWSGPNAVNYSWTDGNGNWFSSSSWTPGGPPSSNDNVSINNGGSVQVLNGVATANVIVLGQLAGNSGSLTLGEGGILSTTQVSKGSGSGTIGFDGGTLRAAGGGVDLLASFNTQSAASEMTVSSSNAYIDTNGFAVGIGASMTGSGALVKQGEGTLTLSGDYSSLQNGVIVNRGTLAVAGNLNLHSRYLTLAPSAGGNASFNVAASGSVDVQGVQIGSEANSSSEASLSGTLGAIGVHIAGAGSSSMTVSGGHLNTESLGIGDSAGKSGTLNVLSGSVSSSFTGIVVGNTNGGLGTLNVSGGSVTGGDSVLIRGAGSGINVSGGSLDGGINVGASAALNISGGNVIGSHDGTITGSANVSGGAWTFSPGVSLNIESGGILNLVGGSVAVDTDHNSVFLNSTGDSIATINIGTGNSAGTLTAYRVLGTGTVNFNHTGNVTFQPFLSGAISVNKLGSGTTTLTAANVNSGPTKVSGGTLLVNNTSGSGTGSGSVTVDSGATLGGSGTISGAVTINSGGTLAPGNSPGRLTLSNSLTLADNSNLSIELGGILAGSGYDQLLVGGTLTLAGSNLNVVLLGGFLPALNQKFFILDSTSTQSAIGTFGNVIDGFLTADASGNTFAVNYRDSDPNDPSQTSLNDISLTYVGVRAVPEPGTNCLIVLGATGLLLIWARSKRQSAIPCPIKLRIEKRG